jgi:hypothetical protein
MEKQFKSSKIIPTLPDKTYKTNQINSDKNKSVRKLKDEIKNEKKINQKKKLKKFIQLNTYKNS